MRPLEYPFDSAGMVYVPLHYIVPFHNLPFVESHLCHVYTKLPDGASRFVKVCILFQRVACDTSLHEVEPVFTHARDSPQLRFSGRLCCVSKT